MCRRTLYEWSPLIGTARSRALIVPLRIFWLPCTPLTLRRPSCDLSKYVYVWKKTLTRT